MSGRQAVPSVRGKPGWLRRLDPLTKGIWLLCTGLAVMLTLSLTAQLLWYLVVLILAGTGAGWRLKQWRLFALWAMGFGLPLLLFQWLMLPVGGDEPLWQPFGSGGPALTASALELSAALTLRSMTLFASSIVYATTTEPRDVVVALTQQLRMPDKLAYAAAVALRFVPLLLAEAEQIRRAERLRRLTPVRGVGGRLQSARRMALAIVRSALRHVQDVSTAMEAKRFGSARARTHWRRVAISPAGWLFAAASIGAAAATLVYF
ncbi:energy-coupling factor transporter transmembrane component T [Paenibacillus agilis]|uniref:Energy-coupling factor transporter transmembrane protein EcfT n=1 Tax=Paenibacillus agilis TaxID=3020863 RepID=A0A559IKU0_9BACL|nr:energy-coupling factor transporter transmembrane component T [Paenibacillus agilis]TVX88278.1 energy-coupling factor transporter transmembrane protein EcfT [Paenibacillus agilis]